MDLENILGTMSEAGIHPGQNSDFVTDIHTLIHNINIIKTPTGFRRPGKITQSDQTRDPGAVSCNATCYTTVCTCTLTK